jgi:hypothetical protein
MQEMVLTDNRAGRKHAIYFSKLNKNGKGVGDDIILPGNQTALEGLP